MHLFYAPDCVNGTAGTIFTLNYEESQHCVKVLRLKNNSKIRITDGAGMLYNAELIENNPKACIVQIDNIVKKLSPRNYSVHIAIAPTKNIARTEWFLEKATEIGIDEITPIYSVNSERTTIKRERFEKIIISALKQSQQVFMPVLNEEQALNTFLDKYDSQCKLIATCEEVAEKKTIKQAYSPFHSVILLIGPEGDFNLDEINKALDLDYQIITLGENRLRTETAALVALQSINFMNL
ncbi:MAG: 16S rRNA (uracil(1498)-N(3))-methyltransferase [Bacteroidales bacterium]|jgi:16S rRNA (uracil1498-N3)-methyltransferase|nr:16S rRNA (uracil(1498)-N(3))-methyltransferase [Bacteroidales bacterium]